MIKTLRYLGVAMAMAAVATTTHGVMGADLVQKNAYAYDIRVNSADKHNPVITYKLNGLASGVTVKALADGEVVATKTGGLEQSNTVTVTIPEAAYGNITFAIDVTTKTTVSKVTEIKDKGPGLKGSGDGYYVFYGPYGLTVNNCPNSETFGRVLVTENRNTSDIYGVTTSNRFTATCNGSRGAMIYAFDPQFQPIANTQAQGQYGFNAGLNVNSKEVYGDFNRIKFSEDGRLFLASGDGERYGVYELDPNDLNKAAKPLLDDKTKVWGMDVHGSGDNLKMVIFTGNYGTSTFTIASTSIKSYELGTGQKLQNPISYDKIAPTMAWYGNNMSPNICIDPDGKGFYAGQYRSNSTEPHYIHTSIDKNYNIDEDDRTTSAFGAGMAYNKDYSLFARVEGPNNIVIYRVDKINDGKKPTYTKLENFAPFTNGNRYVNAIAFDYANNLYACDNSSEYVKEWQLPASYAGSTQTTPSMSSEAYEIEKHEIQKLYVVGEGNGWDPSNPIEVEEAMDGSYTFTIKDADKGFKLSFAKSDNKNNWDAFNNAAIGYSNDGCTVRGGHSQDLYANDNNNNSGNLYAPVAGDWTWTLVPGDGKYVLTLSGRPAGMPDRIYVVGDMTDGKENASYIVEIPAKNFDAKGNPVMDSGTDKYQYTYTGRYTDFRGDFKFSHSAAGIDYGKGSQANEGGQEAVAGASNFSLDNKNYIDFNLNFYYNVGAGTSWANWSGTERGIAVTDLRVKMEEEYNTFYFTASKPAEKAIFHFTARPHADEIGTMAFDPSADESQYHEFSLESTDAIGNSEVVAGENEFKFPVANVFPRNHEYDWTVELVDTDPIITETHDVGGGRAAIACFTDPAYPEVYGYTVIGRSNNTGIDIYDATGKKVASQLYANNAAMGGVNPGMTDTDATPSDGATKGDYLYLSNMSKSSNGIVAFNINEVLNNNLSDPVVAYNGNEISTLGFWGTGSDTYLIAIDRTANEFRSGDSYGSAIYNVIGDNVATDNKFNLISSIGSAQIINARCYVAPTTNGFFLTTHRGDIYGTAGMRYITLPEFGNVWNLVTNDPNKTFSPQNEGSNCVAVSVDGKLLAFATYYGIRLYNLSYADDGKPQFEFIKQYNYPYSYSNLGTAIKFDAAGNIHAINTTYGYFRVLLNNSTLAAAPLEAVVNAGATGVEDIVAGADDTKAVYYNLNGVRVDRATVAPGVYVKVVGKTATKVVIK